MKYPQKRYQELFLKTKIAIFSFTKASFRIKAWQKNHLQQNGTNSMTYHIGSSTS